MVADPTTRSKERNNIQQNEKHEHFQYMEVNRDTAEGQASPVPLVATVVLLLLQMSETNHERRKQDRIVTTPLIIRTGLSSHDGNRKTFEKITST